MSAWLNLVATYISPPHQSLPISRQSSLKERLDAACQSPSSSLSLLPPDSMRRALDASKHDLARAQADTTRLEERCKMLEKVLKETREMLRSKEAELDLLRRERDRERVERRRSDASIRTSTSNKIVYPPRNSSSLDTRISSIDIQKWHRPQSPSPSSISTIATLPDEERARLRSSESYLSRIDSWSGAQVLQAVHDINSEILQFAASATEISTFSTTRTRPATAIQDTAARIGPNMTRTLSTRDHSQDPLLVQLALQGCVSLCIARALSSFCIGFPSKSDAVLAQIFSHIHLNEPQPTSAKWRSLTHQHIHAIYPTLTEYSVNELSDTILRWSADIFLIAGWQSFSSSTTTTDGPITTLLRNLYLDQIKRISRSVLRLAKVAREDIMSTTFEVVVADPTQIFRDASKSNSEPDLAFDMDDATPNNPDKAGLNMVDAFAEYGESKGRVLATMELGLRCITRAAAVSGGRALKAIGEHSNGSSGGDSGETRFEERLLLLPKVVLESVLEVLDR